MTRRQKTGGRKPGSLNMLTKNVKEALEAAFDELGGVESLVTWGKANPSEFYKLWARMLPKDLKAEVKQEPTGRVVIYLPDDGREPTRTAQLAGRVTAKGSAIPEST